MSRNTKYTPYNRGSIQDYRYSSDYKPTINTGNLIPGRKRQFNRVHHDSPPNNPQQGSSGGSQRSIPDENRRRKYNYPFFFVSSVIIIAISTSYLQIAR